MRKLFVLGMIFLMLMGMSGGVFADEPELDIVDTAIAADDFETLVAAVVEADLVDALKGEGPFTVCAPTDAAFADLLATLDMTAAELLALDNLADILLYHVVDGQFLAEDILAAAPFEVETLQGSTVSITVVDGDVFVNDAQVVLPDVLSSNGVIHVIDAVLIPEVEVVDTVLVKLNIGSTAYEKNDEADEMDVEPFIQNDRTFVPIRFVAEAFGLEADWEPKEGLTEVVTLAQDDLLITIQIGSMEITVVEGGVTRMVTSDVAAQIVHDRTFLPLRAVGEILGAEFDWGPKDSLTEWVSFTTAH